MSSLAIGSLDCPSHHSKLDRDGNVLVGPATSPLPHLAVFVDAAGNISVDRFSVVTPSALALILNRGNFGAQARVRVCAGARGMKVP